jgi:hypothetical protein
MFSKFLIRCLLLILFAFPGTIRLKAQVIPLDTLAVIATTDSLKKNAKPDSLRFRGDTIISSKIDTAKKRSPASKAALRSAIIPGWGQAYNKKYWKIPIVYGALAVPVVTFTYNLNWYQKTRYAYTVKYTKDTANFSNIDPQLQPLSTESLRVYRDDFRRNMDYSVIAFLILWGLNVVDAAVDGHLKDFNVNDDLSIRIKPGYSPMANTNGLSIVLNIGKRPGNGYSAGR